MVKWSRNGWIGAAINAKIGLAIVLWIASWFVADSKISSPIWIETDAWSEASCEVTTSEGYVRLEWGIPSIFEWRGDKVMVDHGRPGTVRTVTTMLWIKGKPLSRSGGPLHCFVVHGHKSYASVNFLQIRARPTKPEITGPSSITWGRTGEWTCISREGYPAPNLTWYVDGRAVQFNSTRHERPDKAFDVTSVLRYTPIKPNQTNFSAVCEASQNAWKDAPSTSVVTSVVNFPVRPTEPVIDGPNVTLVDMVTMWNCSSQGGRFRQDITWYLNGEAKLDNIKTTYVLRRDNTYAVNSVFGHKPFSPDQVLNVSCTVSDEYWKEKVSTFHLTRVIVLRSFLASPDEVLKVLLGIVLTAALLILSTCFCAGKAKQARRRRRSSRRQTIDPMDPRHSLDSRHSQDPRQSLDQKNIRKSLEEQQGTADTVDPLDPRQSLDQKNIRKSLEEQQGTADTVDPLKSGDAQEGPEPQERRVAEGTPV